MSRMLFSLAALALVSLGSPAARAQESLGMPASSYGQGGPPTALRATVPLTGHHDGAPKRGLSSWITGVDEDCCGPIGDHNPLQTELYLRSGLTFKFGDGVMADSLQDGWLIQGGGRLLCFNQAGDCALTFDLGLINLHNHGIASPPSFTLRDVAITQSIFGQDQRIVLPEFVALINSYNRTLVSFGPGFEWYAMGAANGTRYAGGPSLRLGADAGGRWGTAKAEFRNLRHFTDTIGAVYAAVHGDYELPVGCCTYFMGLRGEWDYTWSDILQIQNKSDVMGLNFTLSVGVHY